MCYKWLNLFTQIDSRSFLAHLYSSSSFHCPTYLLSSLDSGPYLKHPKVMFYFCRARYEDAKFFYEVDTRKRFSEFRDQLQGILFHVSFPSVHILNKKIR